MRRIALLALPGLAVLLASPAASAQQKGQPAHGPARSSAQFTLRREDAGGPDAAAARARARAGDCAGALPLFDAATRNTVEPTLRRDRGLCHEKLGNPYPAIDDYRAYLVARPDAPDADQIRERLARLEGQDKPRTGDADDDKDKDKVKVSVAARSSADASFSLNESGASASASSSARKDKDRDEVLGPKPGEQGKSFDEYAADERREDEAMRSPLREGEGWILGAFVHVPRYFFGRGGTSDMAYGVGATFRYATSSTFTFVTEIGYAGIGSSGANTSAGGPLVLGGGEVRIPLTRHANDQLLLGGGLGFERYTVSGTRVGSNFWSARFRGGFRHVFGPQIAVDLTADGGPVYTVPDDGTDSSFGGVIGGSVAFLIGF